MEKEKLQETGEKAAATFNGKEGKKKESRKKFEKYVC